MYEFESLEQACLSLLGPLGERGVYRVWKSLHSFMTRSYYVILARCEHEIVDTVIDRISHEFVIYISIGLKLIYHCVISFNVVDSAA